MSGKQYKIDALHKCSAMCCSGDPLKTDQRALTLVSKQIVFNTTTSLSLNYLPVYV